ncbi:hypothetical protein AAFC00_002884 [Neodothiora populina]|uniref:Large ribosomal subunit protein mL54 n=1 Tax=Neodothiora populina TaxID=2781224 RepID=A0ABR3P8Y7_9PEZI
MICSRCIRASLRYSKEQISQFPRRNLSSTTRTAATISPNNANQSAPRQGDPASSHNPPAATSTSAAQPFSSSLTPAAENQALPVAGGNSSQAPVAVKSSVVAGTILKGLNFTKGKQDPVALEDSEYPSWLWGILNEGEAKSGLAATVDEGDLFSKSKKQRRRAAKALRKQQLLNPEALAPKIPMHQQTVDLPPGDGSLQGAMEAASARDSLTKSLRKERRAKIKEANFLKAMG